jgi:hypothetical protein
MRSVEIQKLKISIEVFDEAAHTQAVKIADPACIYTKYGWHHQRLEKVEKIYSSRAKDLRE